MFVMNTNDVMFWGIKFYIVIENLLEWMCVLFVYVLVLYNAAYRHIIINSVLFLLKWIGCLSFLV